MIEQIDRMLDVEPLHTIDVVNVNIVKGVDASMYVAIVDGGPTLFLTIHDRVWGWAGSDDSTMRQESCQTARHAA